MEESARRGLVSNRKSKDVHPSVSDIHPEDADAADTYNPTPATVFTSNPTPSAGILTYNPTPSAGVLTLSPTPSMYGPTAAPVEEVNRRALDSRNSLDVHPSVSDVNPPSPNDESESFIRIVSLH